MNPNDNKELVDYIYDLLDEIETYDYMGCTEDCPKKPFIVKFEDKAYEVEIVMNVRQNGDYDGCEGFNILGEVGDVAINRTEVTTVTHYYEDVDCDIVATHILYKGKIIKSFDDSGADSAIGGENGFFEAIDFCNKYFDTNISVSDKNYYILDYCDGYEDMIKNIKEEK
jgi:hypothetical protein